MIKYLLILLCANLFAQNVGGQFLLVSPSATNNALGGSNVSSNTHDLYTSFSNPAHSIIPQGLSVQSSDIFFQLLPNLASDIFMKTDVKRLSYSGNEIFRSDSYDFQISFTHSDTYLSLGEQIATNSIGEDLGTFNSYSKFKANTISLGFKSKDKPIYFSAGVTKKDVIQQQLIGVLGEGQAGGTEESMSHNEMYDWGYRMVIDNYSFSNINFLDVSSSIGYSKNNITDKFITFEGTTHQDLAPRTARLGLSFGARIRPFKDLENLFISVSFNREAESLLVKEVTFTTSVYDNSMLGAIKIGDNIFKGDSTADVKIQKGREINIFNIYFIRNGRYIEDNGYYINTEGYGIHYSRLALLFLSIFKSPDANTFNNSFVNNLDTFLKLIDVNYNNSKWNSPDPGFPHGNEEYEETTFAIKYEF